MPTVRAKRKVPNKKVRKKPTKNLTQTEASKETIRLVVQVSKKKNKVDLLLKAEITGKKLARFFSPQALHQSGYSGRELVKLDFPKTSIRNAFPGANLGVFPESYLKRKGFTNKEILEARKGRRSDRQRGA